MTAPEHRPENHRDQLWPPERLIAWGAKFGPAVAKVVELTLARYVNPEQGYRAWPPSATARARTAGPQRKSDALNLAGDRASRSAHRVSVGTRPSARAERSSSVSLLISSSTNLNCGTNSVTAGCVARSESNRSAKLVPAVQPVSLWCSSTVTTSGSGSACLLGPIAVKCWSKIRIAYFGTRNGISSFTLLWLLEQQVHQPGLVSRFDRKKQIRVRACQLGVDIASGYQLQR